MAGYGLAIDLGHGQGLHQLRDKLIWVREQGFTHAEIEAKSLGVVMNGELHPARMDLVTRALDGVDLHFTVHGCEVWSARGGNLVDFADPLQRMTVESDIAFAAAIGATVLVYHSGMLRSPGGTNAQLAEGMKHERLALRELADIAAEQGIRIAVENRDPVQRYIDRLVYGMDLHRLADHVEAIDHPNVGICFDTGHAWLAATHCPFDYMEGVRRVAPLVNHIHLSDNFGNPMLDHTHDGGEALVQGLGDLHLLPGWGTVPFDDIAAIPFPQDPIAIVELRESFFEHASDAANAAHAFARKLVRS